MPADLRAGLRVAIAAVVVGALSPGWGCVPRCQRVCDKLLQCEELATDRFAHAECEESCRRQDDIFDRWEDADQLQDRFDDQQRCIVQSTCRQIADGACYDEDLFQIACPGCRSVPASHPTSATAAAAGDVASNRPPQTAAP